MALPVGESAACPLTESKVIKEETFTAQPFNFQLCGVDKHRCCYLKSFLNIIISYCWYNFFEFCVKVFIKS